MSGRLRALLMMGVIVVIAGAIGALAWAVSSSGGGGSAGDDLGSWPGVARTAEVGGIEVEATWLSEYGGSGDATAEYPLDRFVLIRIAFTTHSGDLRRMDIEQSAVLTQGGNVAAPEAWISLSDDSHHRAGVLVFARGQEEGATEMVLVLEEDDVSFVWES